MTQWNLSNEILLRRLKVWHIQYVELNRYEHNYYSVQITQKFCTNFFKITVENKVHYL